MPSPTDTTMATSASGPVMNQPRSGERRNRTELRAIQLLAGILADRDVSRLRCGVATAAWELVPLPAIVGLDDKPDRLVGTCGPAGRRDASRDESTRDDAR